MPPTALLKEALAAGEGIVPLAPCWVPRSFLMPGGRLKLDPRDLYALGAHRGGIDERWFSSTTKADNGPGTPQDEGLSYIAIDGRRVLLQEAIETMGDAFLRAGVMAECGSQPGPMTAALTPAELGAGIGREVGRGGGWEREEF